MRIFKTGSVVQVIGSDRRFVITDDDISLHDWDVPCLSIADEKGNETPMEWNFFNANFEVAK